MRRILNRDLVASILLSITIWRKDIFVSLLKFEERDFTIQTKEAGQHGGNMVS